MGPCLSRTRSFPLARSDQVPMPSMFSKPGRRRRRPERQLCSGHGTSCYFHFVCTVVLATFAALRALDNHPMKLLKIGQIRPDEGSNILHRWRSHFLNFIEEPMIEFGVDGIQSALQRSEEHTSELQSLMRTSYDVFCLKKKTKTSIREIKYIKR